MGAPIICDETHGCEDPGDHDGERGAPPRGSYRPHTTVALGLPTYASKFEDAAPLLPEGRRRRRGAAAIAAGEGDQPFVYIPSPTTPMRCVSG
eukprot:gene18031-622_t